MERVYGRRVAGVLTASKERIKASCARAERCGTFCDLEKRGMATKKAGSAKGAKKETVKKK